MPKLWRPWEQEEQFVNTIDFMEIVKDFHQSSNQTELKCDKCDLKFRRESELRRHKSITHGRKLFSCKICRKMFARRDNLTRHLKFAHMEDSKPSCRHCWKPLSRKDAVQRHEATCSKDILYLSHMERLKLKLEKEKLNLLSTDEIQRTKTAEMEIKQAQVEAVGR